MKRNSEDFKKLYTCLRETEELHQMFRGMSGDWEKDKNKFIESQLIIEEMANIVDIEYDQE
jgi:hypothetical protein